MSWTDVFSGNQVTPSPAQYLALALSADTTLVWPLESAEGSTYLANQLDVTPSTTGLSLLMPPANQGATGIASVITNKGSDDFTVANNSGTQIVVIAAGESWIVALTNNSTANGVWEAIQLGANSPSGSIASALAGYGLVAITTTLNSNIITNSYASSHTLSVAHRATANLFTGAVPGTFTLDAISTLTAGWWAIVANDGTDVLTINTTGGNTINGEASITLPDSGTSQPYSTLIVAAAGGFTAYFINPIPTPIAAGGTGATNAPDALANLGGTAVGISIFTAPSVAAILAILGISQSLLRETTVATNQVVATNSSGTVYVATTSVTLTLPEADTVTTGFYIGGYAQGGDITLSPATGDMINGGAASASLTVAEGSSFLLVTDAATNGNWWPLFLTEPASGTWAVAGGVADAITVAYSPANTAFVDGMLLAFRASAANVTTTPTFAPDALSAHTITKQGGLALVPGDIARPLAECLLRYNAANTRWELLNPASTEPPWAAAGGSADAITTTYAPAITALTDGLLLGFRAASANATATPTFAPNGLTARLITKQGGVALTAGDIPGNLSECLVRYNLANTRWELLNPALGPAGSGTTAGTFSNLKIVNGGSPDTQAIVTASAASVTPASGTPSVVIPNVNLSIDISTSGANGLDTGSVATSTWYAVYVIYNGSNIAGLFSTSATTPTLPAGYTYYGRVGWMRTDGSSHLLRTLQYDNEARYTSPPLPVMASGSAGSITVPNWSAVGVSDYVPSTASHIAIVTRTTGSNTAAIVAPNNSYGDWTSSSNPPPIISPGFGGSAYMAWPSDLMLESTNIYWASQGTGNEILCYGWTDNT